MSAPVVQGWCPGALRPMASGDGLVVRVRPRFARLTAEQARGLCALATRYGDGGLEMTNRANLQLYGVAQEAHADLLDGLRALDLLDADETVERRRNVLIAPDHAAGDLTVRLVSRLYDALRDLPELPPKVGFAVDTGAQPQLAEDPADIRLEICDAGVLLRADGAEMGRIVTEDSAIPALIELSTLFAETRTKEQRRVRQWVAAGALPAQWQTTQRAPAASSWQKYPTGSREMPGARLGHDDPVELPDGSRISLALLAGFAAPFGRIEAGDLADLLDQSQATALRVTPWRVFLLEDARTSGHPAFVTDASDPLLTTSACRGAPACPQALGPTRELARRLAPHAPDLHVSGCAKGCARAAPATRTVVAREGGTYDLIWQGCAWDAPRLSGLTPDELLTELTRT